MSDAETRTYIFHCPNGCRVEVDTPAVGDKCPKCNHLMNPSPEQEAQDWIECPVCGSRDAVIDFYSQEVLLDCPDCDSNVVVTVPPEPTAI